MAAAIAIVVLLFIMPLIGVLFGAFAGWVVGLFFHDTIMTFLLSVGVDVSNLTMWQIGASLGFIGAFFKSTLTQQK